jgi:hypothetical protein
MDPKRRLMISQQLIWFPSHVALLGGEIRAMRGKY